ncbi:4573_t:CDS:1, partial [Gigaspora rosea]
YKIPRLICKLIQDNSVIEAKGPTESIGNYLADLYKAAKAIQYEIE